MRRVFGGGPEGAQLWAVHPTEVDERRTARHSKIDKAWEVTWEMHQGALGGCLVAGEALGAPSEVVRSQTVGYDNRQVLSCTPPYTRACCPLYSKQYSTASSAACSTPCSRVLPVAPGDQFRFTYCQQYASTTTLQSK